MAVLWRTLLLMSIVALVTPGGLYAGGEGRTVGGLGIFLALLGGGGLGWWLSAILAARARRAREATWRAQAAQEAQTQRDLEEELSASGVVAARALDELAKRSEGRTHLEEELAGLRGELAGRKERQSKLEGELTRLRGELASCHERIVMLEGKLAGRERDDLKQIRGIGPALEKLLNKIGITSFRQIASWEEDDIAWAAARLGAFPDRIRRDGWVESAAEAHRKKYGEAIAWRVKVSGG